MEYTRRYRSVLLAGVLISGLTLAACGDEQKLVDSIAGGQSGEDSQDSGQAKGSGSGSERAAEPTTIDALGLRLVAPASWTPDPDPSAMRLAQFTTPGGAEVRVFGGIKGTVRMNLTRWAAQLQGGPEPEQRSFEIGMLKLHLIQGTGNYRSGLPNDADIDGALMLGAIVEGGPDGLLFIKAVGDESALGPEVDEFTNMIRGIKLSTPDLGH